MKKIRNQLIILLTSAVIVGIGLPNNPNPNNPNYHGDNPISVSDSEEKKGDSKPYNNDEVNKPNCDEEERPFSK